MAISAKRGFKTLVVLGLAASLLGFAVSAYALYKTRAVNEMIASGKPGDIKDDARPEALFAKAYRLRNEWELDAALELYHKLEQVPDPELQRKVNYNIGNIYVTRAQVEAQFARYKDIGILIGIARSQYQRALRLDSEFFDAKYNLEYTRFLVTERDTDKQKYEGGLSREYKQRRMDWAEFQHLPRGLP